MGWNSWNRFGPFLSERLVLETADAMVESGMRDAGYRYVVIDDAWEESVRNDDGDLTENRWQFPHGMAWLAEEITSVASGSGSTPTRARARVRGTRRPWATRRATRSGSRHGPSTS